MPGSPYRERVELIQRVLIEAMGYQDSPTMAGEMRRPAENIATALRINERKLPVKVITHMSNQQTTRAVCDRSVTGVVTTNVIDNVNCVACLRKLAKDAGRYGNGRHP